MTIVAPNISSGDSDSNGSTGTGNSGTGSNSATHSSSKTGPIVGGTIGGVAVIALAVGGILYLRREPKPAQPAAVDLWDPNDMVQSPGGHRPTLPPLATSTSLAEAALRPPSPSVPGPSNWRDLATAGTATETTVVASAAVASTQQSPTSPRRRRPPPPPPAHPPRRAEAVLSAPHPSEGIDNPPSPVSEAETEGTYTAVAGLRTDVENLARELRDLHAARMGPAPQYS